MRKVFLAVVVVLALVSGAMAATDADMFVQVGCQVLHSDPQTGQTFHPWTVVICGQQPIGMNADWVALNMDQQQVTQLDPGQVYYVASQRDLQMAAQPQATAQQPQAQQPAQKAEPYRLDDESRAKFDALMAEVLAEDAQQTPQAQPQAQQPAGQQPVPDYFPQESQPIAAQAFSRVTDELASVAQVEHQVFLWSLVTPAESFKLDTGRFIAYEPNKASQVKELKAGKTYLVVGVKEYESARPKTKSEFEAFARPGTKVKTWADGGQQLYLAGRFALKGDTFPLPDGRTGRLVMNYQSPENKANVTVSNATNRDDRVFCTLKLEADGEILTRIPD